MSEPFIKQRWSGSRTKCHRCGCGVCHQKTCYVRTVEVNEFCGDDKTTVLCKTCGDKEVKRGE
jgi:hypothetical protein